ncbi:YihY/virulence factor BrkB family protein [Azospirillum sp. SYSU D00513]|uniref:YihY/virulence factor BrkB family protein n=1 Tax=Azospirillum sp. SYSU D00513 TaxID=2812561 RepID=UPI001A979FF8|nr:YihY/virulence factor BrkB family protein [Azospirillum sp. SYSU D00513]
MLGLSRRHHHQYPRPAAHRGRLATTPSDIPKAGWKDILWRTWDEQSKDNISMIAAGVAYYALLAIFPAIAAMVSLFGIFADPAGIEQQVEQLNGLLPPEALEILRSQAHSVATAPPQGLGFGVLFGLLLTLWSASRGTNSLITALNIAYGEQENRSFLWLAALSLMLTVAGLLFLIVTLGMIVAVPAAINAMGLEETMIGWVARLARWPILAAAIMFVLAVLYRYAPDRREAKWRWVSWGAGAATFLWLLGSVGFSVYVSNFGSYNETYGSVGAVVVLLLWFNLTAYVILMGAELNAEIEHQTVQDTTANNGNERPLGQRGAYVADTVGQKRA